MSFEYDKSEEITASPGSRNFYVLTHHSNRFGVVFNTDRNFYSWNCVNGEQCQTPRRNNHLQFQVSNESMNFPYMYE